MPWAGRALEIGDHRVEHQPRLLAQHLGGGEDQLARDRVALLRHRRAGAAAGDKRFGRLAELGCRHQHHVKGDLAEAAGQQRQKLHGFGDAVAGDVPGDRRVAEAEFASEFGAAAHGLRALAERGERAGGAAELGEQHARAKFRKARGMAVEGGEPDCRLVAEGDRQGVLQMGAAGHRGVAIAAGEVGEVAARRREISLDQLEPGADLQHHGGVHDVLGGGAPMQPAPGLAGPIGELADQWQDRIADRLGLALQAREVERSGRFGDCRRRFGDGRGRFGRDDPEPGLGAGERRLDLGAAGEERQVGRTPRASPGCRTCRRRSPIENADRHRPVAFAPHPGLSPQAGRGSDLRPLRAAARNRSSRRRSAARAPGSAPCRPSLGCRRSSSRDRHRAGPGAGIARPATECSSCRGCVSGAADRKSYRRPRRRHRAGRPARRRGGSPKRRETRRSWCAPGCLRPSRDSRHNSSRPFRCRRGAPADRPKTGETAPGSRGPRQDRRPDRDWRCGCAGSNGCGRTGRRRCAPARTKRRRGKPGGRRSGDCGETRRATDRRKRACRHCHHRRVRQSACALPEPGRRGRRPARSRRTAATARPGRRLPQAAAEAADGSACRRSRA